MADHDPQVVAVFGVGRAPDVLEQLLLGNDPPRVPRQLRQYRVLLAGQGHFGAVQQHPSIRQVHRQRTEHQRGFLWLARRGLAQQGADAGEKLLDAERFGHVIVGTVVQRLDLLRFAGPYREHQHRHRRPLAKLAQHLLAVHVRQAQVEYQQIGLVQRRLGKPFSAGTGFQHLVALGAQADAQEFADLRFVIDNQRVAVWLMALVRCNQVKRQAGGTRE